MKKFLWGVICISRYNMSVVLVYKVIMEHLYYTIMRDEDIICTEAYSGSDLLKGHDTCLKDSNKLAFLEIFSLS